MVFFNSLLEYNCFTMLSVSAMFFFNSLLEYNCFTMLSVSAVHHESATLHTYIPALMNLPSTPPLHPSRMSQSTELSTLTEEWIKMMWYIHAMEYYSAKKRSTTGSSVAMQMSLTPLIEWSESEKKAIHCSYSVTQSCPTLFATPWTTARQA